LGRVGGKRRRVIGNHVMIHVTRLHTVFRQCASIEGGFKRYQQAYAQEI